MTIYEISNYLFLFLRTLNGEFLLILQPNIGCRHEIKAFIYFEL